MVRKTFFRLLAGLCAVLSSAASVRAQTTLYVDSARTASGVGTSWATAYKTLQEALVAAAANTGIAQIQVAKGTYYPTAAIAGCTNCTGPRDYTFTLPRNNLAIYGGYPAAGGTRNVAFNKTILSGDIDTTAGRSGGDAYHVVFSTGLNNTAVLDGFTITGGNGGNANVTSSVTAGSTTVYTYSGGGMYNFASSPSVLGCTFSGNACASSGYNVGGGMYNENSASPLVTNCVFSNNLCANGGYNFGGGMFNTLSSAPVLTGCVFVGNTCIAGSNCAGGGIYNDNSAAPVVVNCTFSANTCNGGGGTSNLGSGINNSSSSATLRNCILWGNAPSSSTIANISSTTTVTYSDVQGGFSGTGNQNADPLFANPASPAGPDGVFATTDDGLRLLYGSHAIDSGTATGAPATDLTGTARPQGAGYDLGAYEGGTCLSTVYVDSSVSASGTGVSWGTALKTVQEAFDRALLCSQATQILVAKGTYYPTATIAGCTTCSSTRDYTFTLPRNNLAIYGGYPTGGGTRSIAANKTILSGDIDGTAGSSSGDAYHVVFSTGRDTSAILDGFIITGGNANVGGSVQAGGQTVNADEGGGLYNIASSPTINACVFTANTAQNGAGMYNEQSSGRVTSCVFAANTATGGGGGALNTQSSTVVTSCTFSANTASIQGGGLWNNGTTSPVLRNCIVWGNTAPTGPGIYNTSGSVPAITYSDVQGGYTGTGNLATDPLFSNPGNPAGADGIFATADDGLKPFYTSPALDAGAGTGAPAIDVTGAARPQGAGQDMGAYEGGVCAPTMSVVYVDSAVSISGAGVSWATAFKTLQEALARANECAAVTQIQVAKGTYKPTTTITGCTGCNSTRDYTFTLPRNNLMILGGYPTGGGTRSTTANVTVLSGDVDGTPGISAGDVYHVVFSNGCDTTAVLDGLTITGGNANVLGSVTLSGGKTVYAYRGGGMYNLASSPKLIGCLIRGNTASNDGGGMCNDASSPIVNACTFSANSVSYYGGGMYNTTSSPTVSGCTFSTNSTSRTGAGMYNAAASAPAVLNCTFATNTANTEGGGMYNTASSPTVTGCTFSGNNATNAGGGMYNTSSSSPAVSGCTFSGNSTVAGGGMCNVSSSPVVSGCTFSTNSVSSSGAGMYNTAASPTVAGCMFSGNKATNAGGGMYNTASSPQVTNCIFLADTASVGGGMQNGGGSAPRINGTTFSMNNGFAGGAIENSGASVTATGCTFSGNSASAEGGAIYAENGGKVSLRNCILTGNSAPGSGGAVRVLNGNPSFTAVACVFDRNRSSGNDGGALSLVLGTGTDTLVNCVFSRNKASGSTASNGGGALVQEAGTSSYLVGNTFYADTAASKSGAIRFKSGGTNRYLYNNLFYKNYNGTDTISVSYESGTSLTGGSNNLFGSNPVFLDETNPAGADTLYGTADDGLRLGYCSPAINAGTNSQASGVDVTGAPRIQGGTVDIGAYEREVPAGSPATRAAVVPVVATTTLVPTCEENGWTYYAIPGNADSVALAIAWGTSTAAKAAATVTVATLPTYTEAKDASGGTWAAKRSWNVALNGQSLAGTVGLRWYYLPADTAALKGAATAAGFTPSWVKWVHTVNGATAYNPSLIQVTGSQTPVVSSYSTGSSGTVGYVQYDNLSYLGGGTALVNGGAFSVLLVELLSFEAKKDGARTKALLDWGVGVENGVDHYEVERSADGSRFEILGTAPAVGTVRYGYTDAAPLAGLNYYRIKTVNRDGAVAYSAMRSLEFGKSGGSYVLTVVPNPAHDRVWIRTDDPASRDAAAVVTDAVGRVLVRVSLVNGEAQIQVADWMPGVYLVKLASGAVAKMERR